MPLNPTLFIGAGFYVTSIAVHLFFYLKKGSILIKQNRQIKILEQDACPFGYFSYLCTAKFKILEIMKSMYLSLVALIVAILALVNSLCGFRDSNLIISFLGVLVTLLIGWNIIQFIFAENTMHKIARDASDIVASETAKTIADDINHIFVGKLKMQEANGPCQPGKEMLNLDIVFQALNEYSKCYYHSAAQSSVDAALLNLQRHLLNMQSKGGLRVLEGKRDSYISILERLHSPNLRACNALLYKAQEKPKEYDTEILTPEDKETLRVNADPV